MNTKSLILSAVALFASSSANAAFQTLNNGDDISSSALDFQILASGLGPDQGYALDGDAVASSYFPRFAIGFLMPADYTVLDTNTYQILFPEDGEEEEIGILTDQVWRNNLDNTLVFATRVTLLPEIEDEEPGELEFEYEGEFNEISRDYGSYATSAGWFAQSTIDRTFDSVEKEDGVVTFVNDMSGEEDNPYSVWHLVATDATDYVEVMGALTMLSEEDEDEGRPEDYIFGADRLAFAPAPVPVPAALPLLASALFGLGFTARKRS